MKIIEYTDSETVFEGVFYSAPGDQKQKPCLIIAHAWDGVNAYIKQLALEYSARGLHTFAMDLYGKGVRGAIDGDNSHLMNPLLDDRELLHKRLLAGFNTVKSFAEIDATRIYVLGFCFGGLCALDLARLNPPGLKKAAAVHSLLHAPQNIHLPDTIEAEVLLLHGWKDPVARPDAFLAFCDEMHNKKTNWSVKVYGNAMHAFTHKGAAFPERGILYDQKAAEDAFKNLQEFFEISA